MTLDSLSDFRELQIILNASKNSTVATFLLGFVRLSGFLDFLTFFQPASVFFSEFFFHLFISQVDIFSIFSSTSALAFFRSLFADFSIF